MPERRAEQAAEATSAVDTEDSEPEVEDLPRDLTDVAATVVEDANARVRPGLAWPVIER